MRSSAIAVAHVHITTHRVTVIRMVKPMALFFLHLVFRPKVGRLWFLGPDTLLEHEKVVSYV
jgi:hypothetical protein